MTNRIQTPDGVFNSQREAAKHYGISDGSMWWFMKQNSDTHFVLPRDGKPPLPVEMKKEKEPAYKVTLIDLRKLKKQ